ncbi:aldehyde dehydrogenase [Angustibacter sp. Root456]|nr:aldehyde dehydrogenase [Angustibacter sp. Root456]
MQVDGGLTASESGEWLVSRSPATGHVIGRFPRGTGADSRRAVLAARRALATWRTASPAVREAAFLAAADDVEARADELARLLSRETGNALRTQARPEIASVIDLLRYFAGAAYQAQGVTVPALPDVLTYTIREPFGVVAAVVPWNAPAQLSVVKIAMALSMGNTMVLKPAEDASLVVLEVTAILQRHLPPGVLNVVTGLGPEIGAALMSDPDVDKLSFTGSTAVGRSVLATAAQRILPVSLELGGKSPAIVFPDSDDDRTAAGVVAGMRFTRQGQSCTAGSRLFVHESVFESFLQRVADAVSRLVVGDPLDDATDMGSIINEKQYARVVSYVASALADGATARTGGVPQREPHQQGGWFMQPTILTGLDATAAAACEEIFGPVMVAIPWHSEDEVVEQANASSYGLAGYVWSRDVATALRMAGRLQAGWVQVNRAGGQYPGLSYGGTKESGIGREFSIQGAIDSYTYAKSVSVDVSTQP